MKKYLLFLLLLFSFNFCCGQVKFQKIYRSGTSSSAHSIERTFDGGYIIAGSASGDGYLLKLNSYGDTVWTKTYQNLSNSLDFPSVKQTIDSGYIICGSYDAVLLKVDSIGNILWAKEYNPVTTVAYGVIETIAGDYILIGLVSSLNEYTLCYKTDANGNEQAFAGFNPGWTSNLHNDRGSCILQTKDSGLAVCGMTDTAGSWHNAYLAKMDASNNIRWCKMYGENGQTCYINSLAQTTDSGYALCGYSYASGIDSFLVIRTDKNGNLLWSKKYDGGTANSIKQTTNGGLIIVGNYHSGSIYDAYAVYTDINGNLLWSKRYGAGGNEYAYDAELADNGGYMIVGSTNSFGNSSVYVIKTDSLGNSGCNEVDFIPTIVNSATNVNGMPGGIRSTFLSNVTIVPVSVVNFDSTLCYFQCTLSASISNSIPLCYGDSNASATVTASGGTEPYTYSWSTGDTTATINNMPAGNYTVSVFDSVGCSATQVITITQPAVLTANAQVINNPYCYGQSNGTVTCIVSGGTASYTYAWSPIGSIAQTANNLPAGCYTVTVTDANGCSASSSVCLTEPAPLTATDSILHHVTCYDSNDEVVTVIVSGGTPGYSYVWFGSGCSEATCSNLSASPHVVAIIDTNGCATFDTIALCPVPVPITISEVLNNVSCNADNNGSARITAQGGAGNYTYSWNPSVSASTTASLLAAGCYTITVTDANGCSVTDTVCITEPPQLIINAYVISNSTCYQYCDGSATVNVTGGTPPYSYIWPPYGSYNDTLGFACSSFTCVVTDNNGCSASQPLTITEPPQLAVSLSATDASCSTCNDGSILATAGGGTTPYTYSWIPTGPNNLPPGIYTCCVTDANGCTTCTSDTVSYPTSINEIAGAGISIHPNPAHSAFTISFPAPISNIEYQISIYDFLGNKIAERSTNERSITFDLSGYAEGVYNIKIAGGGKVMVRKIVVMKE